MAGRVVASLAILTAACVLCFAHCSATARADDPEWRVMPIRGVEEHDLGLVGGENTQHMQGIARSVSNPDVIYLSHDCGQFWRSDNNGVTWHKTRGEGCLVHAGQSIEVDPTDSSRVFAVVDNTYNYYMPAYDGLYRSTDGGESWQLILHKQVNQQRMYQHSLAYDPSSVTPDGAQRWYVAFSDNDPSAGGYTPSPDAAVYRSEDGGDTWTRGASLVGHFPVYAVQTHPTDDQRLYVATNQGLFVSTDRGASLAPLGDVPAGAVSGLAVHPDTASTLYAVRRGSGLYRSTNGGTTFSLLKSFNAARVFLNPSYPNVMYLVALSGQSIVSSNGGSTWTSVVVTPPPGLGREWKTSMNGDMAGVVPDLRDPDKAVAYFNAEVWKTEDAGLHWTDSSTLFTGYAASWGQDSIVFDRFDGNRFVLFCCDVSMLVTENAGRWFTRYRIPWEWYSQGLISWPGTYAGDIQPIPGSQTIVASTGMYWDTKLVRTTDGGANWTIVSNDSENHLFITFHPDDPNLCFAGNKKSTDAGATWQAIAYLDGYSASIFGMCRAQPDTIYAVSRPRNDILRSDDRGQTWRVYAATGWYLNGMDSKPTFAVDPVDPDKVYTLDSSGDLATFDGTTWTSLGVLPLAGGAPYHNYVRAVAIDPRHPEIIYAGMHTCGLPTVFRSTDAGATWTDITANISRLGGMSLAVSPHTGDLFHGSCFGTWVYPPPYESPDSIWPNLLWDFAVQSWEALADHGPAGQVARLVTDGACEPRLAGLRTIRLVFSLALDPATIVAGAVTIVGDASGDQSSLIQSMTLDGTGKILTVELSSPAPDGDVYAITVADSVRSQTGLAPNGPRGLVLDVLAGDVDGSGAVTAADLLAARAAVGQPVDATTAACDLDGSGDITGTDLLAVRARFGAALPQE